MNASESVSVAGRLSPPPQRLGGLHWWRADKTLWWGGPLAASRTGRPLPFLGWSDCTVIRRVAVRSGALLSPLITLRQ